MPRALLALALACLGCSASNPPVSTGGNLGAPCASVADCRSGLSCETSIDFPTPTCALACDPAQPDACPENHVCAALQSGSFCMQRCIAGVPCTEDQRCTGEFESINLYCAARDTVPEQCAWLPRLVAGGQVGPSAEPTECQKPVVESALPPGQVQRLGTHAVNDTVQFEVPPGTWGLNLIEQAVQASEAITYFGFTLDNAAVPLRITGPAGEVLYDDFDVSDPPETQYIYAGAPAPVMNVVTVPASSPSLADVAAHDGLPAGTWSLVVNDYANECAAINEETPDAGCDGGSTLGQYDVTVVTRPKPQTGQVDLAFYLVNEGLLTSAEAVADPAVIRMVRTVAQLYGKQGICVGTVTFFDLPAWARAKYASSIDADETAPCSNLFQLFTLSQPGNTLNFFLVESITSSMGGGFSVVGLDGTIPGPSSFGGGLHSGAAVSSADLEGAALNGCGPQRDFLGCGPDFVGYVAAHEGGHWLGLFHTTEADGELFDPLKDTPTCACEQCAGAAEQDACGGLPDGGITVVTGADCSSGGATCGGADDLMFWLIDPGTTGRLSDEQAAVMKSNVAVQ